MKTSVIEKQCKDALNRINSKYLPYKWDLNIYRGCSHSCEYCFAMYSHKYIEGNYNFTKDIVVKTNIAEKLEMKLRSKTWKGEVVNLGGVTDSYQELESEYKIMPEILKLLIKYRTPAFISTKSDLILRDFDLLEELARVAHVSVAETIVTVDDEIRKKIEPGASPINNRFKVLKEFATTNVTTGLHLMPIIPYITDNIENLEKIYYYAKRCNVDYVLPSVLNLKGITKPNFMKMVQKQFPEKYNDISSICKTGFCSKEYRVLLYEKINILKEKYHISSYKIIQESEQLKLKI